MGARPTELPPEDRTSITARWGSRNFGDTVTTTCRSDYGSSTTTIAAYADTASWSSVPTIAGHYADSYSDSDRASGDADYTAYPATTDPDFSATAEER